MTNELFYLPVIFMGQAEPKGHLDSEVAQISPPFLRFIDSLHFLTWVDLWVILRGKKSYCFVMKIDILPLVDQYFPGAPGPPPCYSRWVSSDFHFRERGGMAKRCLDVLVTRIYDMTPFPSVEPTHQILVPCSWSLVGLHRPPRASSGGSTFANRCSYAS